MLIPLYLTIIIIFSILSGFSKAICDLSEENKLKFKNKNYWIKEISSINKWKLDSNNQIIIVNGKKVERFFGSSRWFVLFTCGWHLFQTIQSLSYIIIGVFCGLLISINIFYIFSTIGAYILSRTIFHIFHTYKILK